MKEIVLTKPKNQRDNLPSRTTDSWKITLNKIGNVERCQQFNTSLNKYVDKLKQENTIIPSSLKRNGDYSYEVTIPSTEEIDYNHTYEYWKEKTGGCSSARIGNFHIRNLDWYYNYDCEVLIHTEANENRLESWQVLACCDDITEIGNNLVVTDNGFKYAVADTVDGINEYGLSCNTNVVPNLSYHLTSKEGTNPVEGVQNLCSKMVTRYILDHYKTVDEVIENLISDTNIFFPNLGGYEHHWMVCDSERTVIIEIDPLTGELSFIEPGVTSGYKNHKPVMTNFHISHTIVDENGYMTRTNEDYTACPSNIEDSGAGVERYNLLVSYINETETISLEVAKSIITSLHYSNAYTLTENVWYTEFVDSPVSADHLDQLTKVYSSPDDFQTILNYIRPIFEQKQRSDYYDSNKIPVWVTTHSSIFDLSNNQMNIHVGEESEKWIEKIIN